MIRKIDLKMGAGLYLLDVNEVSEEEEAVVRAAFPKRYERASVCRQETEKKQILAAGVLLYRVAGINGEEKIRIGEKGKPMGEKPFSISHSGSLTAIAVAEKNAGLDIQLIRSEGENRQYSPRILKKIASPEELRRAEEAPEMIMKLWTMKEAVGKLFGTGIPGNLSKINCLPLLEGKSTEAEGIRITGEQFRWKEKNEEYEISIVIED